MLFLYGIPALVKNLLESPTEPLPPFETRDPAVAGTAAHACNSAHEARGERARGGGGGNWGGPGKPTTKQSHGGFLAVLFVVRGLDDFSLLLSCGFRDDNLEHMGASIASKP